MNTSSSGKVNILKEQLLRFKGKISDTAEIEAKAKCKQLDGLKLKGY